MEATHTVVTHDTSLVPTHRPPSPAVRLSARVPLLVHAGLAAVLQPYRDRVRLLDLEDPSRPHVELFDPETSPPPTRLGPAAPRVPRLALTWNLSADNRALAHGQGAVRVLPLSISVVQLVTAVEQAHLLRPSGVAPEGGAADRGLGVALAPREADVVRGICRGLSNAEIAEELFLSVNSVKTYIRTAYRKLGVVSRSQAVLWGVAHLPCVQAHPVGVGCPECRVDAARRPHPASPDEGDLMPPTGA